jgi:hypothetical protein
MSFRKRGSEALASILTETFDALDIYGSRSVLASVADPEGCSETPYECAVSLSEIPLAGQFVSQSSS